jgi:PilX N-terminal
MTHSVHGAGGLRDQEGLALLCTLMVTSLLGMLGAALVFLATTESLISGNHRTAQQAFYGAEAGIERAMAGLATMADWSSIPGPGGAPSIPDFIDGAAAAPLGDGTSADLAQLTAARQADSDAFYAPTPNRPVWQLLAHAPLDWLTGPGAAPVYVIVWIADDVDEADGDPLRDSNGVLMLRAEALGLRGARRRVEVTVAHDTRVDPASPPPDAEPLTPAGVRIVSWRVQ